MITSAKNEDSKDLTTISFESKGFWKYPNDYMKIWSKELTITPKYINQNIVFTYNINSKIVGFYSIINNPNDNYIGDIYIKKGYWLEHIFILPEFHKQGIGTKLISHALQYCKIHNINELYVFSDPYAKGFYEKLNASFLYNSKSSIPNREIPVYSFKIV